MGDFTIKEVLEITNRFYKNRFKYMKKDVIKRITIKEVINVERHDKPGQPSSYKKYVIESTSYPQYSPYYTKTDRRGRQRSYQRSVKHEYDVVLELDRLSINTENWTSRVGSGRVWEEEPPQGNIKQLYKSTKRRFKRKADRLGKTKKEKNQEYKKIVEKHKKRAKYLDIGDYNSRVKKINGDWIFRCDYAYSVHGHRFGRNYYGNVPAKITNPNNIVFFTKHQLSVINQLMQKGILKDD